MRRLLSLSLPFLCLAACGADELAAAGGDTPVFVDTSTDAVPADTTVFDTTPSDTAGDAEVREVEGPLAGLKPDPSYLVPGNIAPKSGAVAAGDLVAWVEQAGDTPELVVWNLLTPDIAPRTFTPPNLLHPRDLALSDAYLVYVDDRYGDPDVFAVDLASGDETAVVNRPGAQEAPAIFGSRVAWEDCGGCVTGDGPAGHEPGREIAERDLAGGPELARTADGVADRAPRYGLLADGRPALAWVSGRATLRVERLLAGVSATHDVAPRLLPEQEVGRVALWDGLIAWRPSPLIVNPDSMIVNPDSMYPSDVLTTAVADGATAPLTTHAEIAQRMTLAPAAFAARLAWLESPPGQPETGRVMLSTGGAGAIVAEAPGIVSFGMGRDFVVFTAPRADNGGAEDVHVLRLDLP